MGRCRQTGQTVRSTSREAGGSAAGASVSSEGRRPRALASVGWRWEGRRCAIRKRRQKSSSSTGLTSENLSGAGGDDYVSVVGMVGVGVRVAADQAMKKKTAEGCVSLSPNSAALSRTVGMTPVCRPSSQKSSTAPPALPT
jgi:hypothetical protein